MADGVNTFKTELYFEHGQYGWSEVWWYRSSGNIDQAFNAASELVARRVKLLARDCFLKEYMVSLQGLFRDSRQSSVENRNTTPVNKYAPEMPFTALLVRQQSGTRYRRALYMRGIPKGLSIPDDGDYPSTPVYFQQFANLFAYLSGADRNWSIQSVSKEPGEQGQAVTSFVQGAAAIVGPPPVPSFQAYTVVRPAIAGVFLGDTVRLRSPRGASALNIPPSGVYKVITSDVGGTTISTNWRGPNVYQTGATIVKETSLHYSGGIQLIPLRLVRRNAGVIHLQTKGRKKARK